MFHALKHAVDVNSLLMQHRICPLVLQIDEALQPMLYGEYQGCKNHWMGVI